MIFVTGDTHIPHDISKLRANSFRKQKQMRKSDYLLICGDFGGVWNNSKEELYWRKWLEDKPFTTLFVDGNHENHDLLSAYQVEQWHGGSIHRIGESVLHLMRGQIFDIDGFKFFTMGGGESIDRRFRTVGKSWWAQEIPSELEYGEALKNLDRHHWQVDYVITHTASMPMMKQMNYIKEDHSLTQFLNELEERLQFRHWYFGHFHEDRMLDEKHTVIYQNILQINKE